VNFAPFFAFLKKSLLGLFSPLYDALQNRGRSTTHRRLTSIRGLVLDFKLPIYQGF
jgi:hypothetical protein